MKKLVINLMTIFLLWNIWACSTVKIVNTEPADNFSLFNYRTFNFYDVEAEGSALSADYSQRVDILKNEISKQLQKRGLRQSASQPDLLVNLGIVVEEKVQTRQTDLRTDAPRYIGQRRYSWKSEKVEVGRYKEGTVTVHLVDRAQNKMVWRGVAAGVIPAKTKKLEKTIAEGAEELFARIPSQAQ
jgi:hypothetical protein